MANYDRELKMGADIRKKEKVEKVTEFAERMKKKQEEAEAVLQKVQEEIKQQADKEKNKTEEWKKGNRIILSMKNLVFREKLARNLVNKYIGLYFINKVVFTNAVKLQLLTLIRIYSVVNISQIVQYKEQIRGQKVEEVKLVEVKRVEE